jgi:H+/gluconate symporter-like permease
MGLIGILIALGLLIWLAYRGWSILLLAPAAAILAAALAGEPLLAHWTQTFMASAAQFVMQFFPIFLLGALFGKLMEDSGSVSSIAKYMTERLGHERSVLAVVLAGLPQKAPARPRSLHAVGVKDGGPIGLPALQRVMHHVADHDRLLAL